MCEIDNELKLSPATSPSVSLRSHNLGAPRAGQPVDLAEASRAAIAHSPQLPQSPKIQLEAINELPAITARNALFLDFDGTLVDLAEDPDAIVLPVGLTLTLLQLQTRLNGALAVVSGRSLKDLDRFLEPLRLPLAAEHGAQRRMTGSDEPISLARPDLRELVQSASSFAAANPGLRVESKQSAVALHYRQAPHLQSACVQFMTAAVEAIGGVELLHGKCVLEIKPSGISKGTAISDFMKLPAFKGRVPVFAGDDTTDESGFSVVEALGGIGIKVGAGATLASRRCEVPADILRWLGQVHGEPPLNVVASSEVSQQPASP